MSRVGVFFMQIGPENWTVYIRIMFAYISWGFYCQERSESVPDLQKWLLSDSQEVVMLRYPKRFTKEQRAVILSEHLVRRDQHI